MITELTKEQKARFPEFVDKWTRIGLCTAPANRPEAEKGVIEAYRIAGLKAPKIVWCDSPLSQGLTRAIIMRMDASVRASVGASVWDSVRASVGDSVRASVGDSVRDSVCGQHEASWLGFFDFFHVVCQLTQTERLTGLSRVAQNAGWWLPHEQLCWISERYNILHRNEQGRLHKDEGAALAYPDGFAVYALNGIRMKPDYVLTPAEKLDPRIVLQETNVDIRRELLRKIGIERYLSVTKHKVLDRSGDYELLSIELTPEIRDARYLKMRNPSVGVWHVEGVHPTCQTVQHANNWRASGDINKEWKPELLT